MMILNQLGAIRPSVWKIGRAFNLHPATNRVYFGSESNERKFPLSVPVLPVFKRPIFPGIVAPIAVPNETYHQTLVQFRDKVPCYAGVFLAKDSELESRVQSVDQIHDVGLLGQVMRVFPHKQGLSQVVLVGLCRIRASKQLSSPQSDEPLHVQIEEMKDFATPLNERQIVQAYESEIISTIKELLKLNPMFKEQYATIVEQADLSKPGDLADCVAGLTNADPSTAQKVLEELALPERMKLVLELIKREVEFGALQQKIGRQVDPGLNKNQRRYMLLEQMRNIKKELGIDNDEKDTLLTKFQDRLSKLNVNDSTSKVINEEISKLASLEPTSSEFNVTRNYLDWLTILPWNVFSTDSFDIRRAREILDEDHFGLDDVKERILEFIAVGKLKGTVDGKIICFVGPPGVGKTSLGKSIARAVDRKFYRFSVGGMTDVAEIKGHRRTYVGAMPGKVLQALKITKTANPVLLIDEIDKLGKGISGDPASSLLEVLDPEQNSSFLDHYLDAPFDVSNILFLVTANTLSTIPRPLLDRMEVLTLSGYVLEEKVEIAKKYLLPRALESCGLTTSHAVIRDNALKELAHSYCREAGVRNFQQHIEKILRKISLKVASGEEDKITVTKANLKEYVGNPIFISDRNPAVSPPGVAMGLAFDSMGGSAMWIETIARPHAGGLLQITGRMGDVMKESTDIAYSFARTYLTTMNPSNQFFDTHALHMHVPEGAVPKDGPSAGVTMVTSLLSLSTDQSVRHNVAMTGEITLTGKILRIGGVKEKTMAARRADAEVIIFPLDNKADYEELPDYITDGLEAHFVSTYNELYPIVFASNIQPTTSNTKSSPAPPTSPASAAPRK